jgi:hypothetical protein
MNQLTTRTLQVAMFYETAITMNELSALLDQVFIGHVGAGVGSFYRLGRRVAVFPATRVVIVVVVGTCHLGGCWWWLASIVNVNNGGSFFPGAGCRWVNGKRQCGLFVVLLPLSWNGCERPPSAWNFRSHAIPYRFPAFLLRRYHTSCRDDDVSRYEGSPPFGIGAHVWAFHHMGGDLAPERQSIGYRMYDIIHTVVVCSSEGAVCIHMYVSYQYGYIICKRRV